MDGLGDTWSGTLWLWCPLARSSTACTVGTAVDNVAKAATRLITSWNCILKNKNICNWISHGENGEAGEASVSVHDVFL
jgi:hypothetical protein